MTTRLEMLEKMIAGGSHDPFVHYAYAMELRSTSTDDAGLQAALSAFEKVKARFEDYVPTYLMAAQVCDELSDLNGAETWATAGIKTAEKAGDGHAKGELEAFLAGL